MHKRSQTLEQGQLLAENTAQTLDTHANTWGHEKIINNIITLNDSSEKNSY
jgi:hypothetical protein